MCFYFDDKYFSENNFNVYTLAMGGPVHDLGPSYFDEIISLQTATKDDLSFSLSSWSRSLSLVFRRLFLDRIQAFSESR